MATSLGLTLVGCSKKKSEDEKAKAEKPEADAAKKKPQGDRFADGQKLDAALKDWSKRWSEQADLPACDPLVKEPATLELCKTAAASLTTLKAAVAKPEPAAALIHAAAELALATENASEKLRLASMEKMQAEHKLSPASSGHTVGKLPPGAMSAMPKARAMPSSLASAGKLGKPGEAPPPLDPSMQVMQSYSRVNRAALRYISQFLQFGALPVRKVAFGELEALSKRKETWPALSRTLREAAMAENDPELLGKLKALAPKLSRRTPTALGGHPPVAPGAVPAPAASE